ncbi:MAG TPA: hypothetical protein VFU93_05210 [Acidimicrobiales bacterium]|nr:hypothetical protein [Acidimicrobiales bacterium]
MADHDPYSSPEAHRESSVVWTAVVAVLAATVLLAGVLSALTNDDATGVDDPLALLSSAPDAALDARTARIVMKMEMEGGMSVNMSAEGLVDFETGASSLTMSMVGNELEMRTVDDHFYMRLPDVGQPLGITTPWVGMPVDAAGTGSYTGSPSAAAMIDSLRGVSRDIESLGRDEVNGVDANGFRVTIDLERALQQVPEADRARAEESMAQLRGMGMAEMPMEVWVTDGGLPVRMVMEMEGIGGTGASMRSQMDYVDFGLPVDITAPPAEDVTMVQDQAQLQQLLGGQSLEYVEPAASG